MRRSAVLTAEFSAAGVEARAVSVPRSTCLEPSAAVRGVEAWAEGRARPWRARADTALRATATAVRRVTVSRTGFLLPQESRPRLREPECWALVESVITALRLSCSGALTISRIS
jgi:hypothetical protein